MGDQKIFSARLRELLVALGLNQTEFARRLRVNESLVSLWLSGKRTPSYGQVQRIIDTFHINPSRLFRWE